MKNTVKQTNEPAKQAKEAIKKNYESAKKFKEPNTKTKTELPLKGQSSEPVESSEKNREEGKGDHLGTALEIEEVNKKKVRSSAS